MKPKNVNQSNICLKENGVTQFELKKHGNIFKTFYSELAGNLVKKLPKPSLKFNTNKTDVLSKIKTKFREIRTHLYYGRNH